MKHFYHLYFDYLIIHFQIQKENCASFTFEHFLGFNNDVGNKSIKGSLFLK